MRRPPPVAPRPEKSFVIAGSYEQFYLFIHKFNLSPRDYVYIPDSMRMRGLYGRKVILTGTWWNNDAADLRTLARDHHTIETKEY